MNVGIFLAVVLLNVNQGALFDTWGLVPGRLLTHLSLGELTTLVTSMFLHAGWLHIVGNMLFLYAFGGLVERSIGSKKFIWIYFLSGLGAALAQILVGPTSLIPMVGASGAISGVLASAVVLKPKDKITVMTPLTLFIPISLSLWVFGILWLLLQFAGVMQADGVGSGIAFWAHIGGYIVGHWRTRILNQKSHKAVPLAHVAYGPAKSSNYRTFTVTDSQGRIHLFHEELR